MNLLVISGGKHPYHQSTPVLIDFLKSANHTVDLTENPAVLLADKMQRYDALIFNTRRVEELTLTLEQRAAMAKYIEGGKGFICIHCAGGLPEDWPEYHDITGGGWVYSGMSTTPGYGQFQITVKDDGNPCASNISDFITNDELYMNLGWRQDNDVFLACQFGEISQPVAWTRKYGKGRVLKTTLGHDGLAFRTPEFQQLILNGVNWTTGNL